MANVEQHKPEIEQLSDDWQPIETAPKDGSRILAFSEKAKAFGQFPIRCTWWRNMSRGDSYTGWGEFNSVHWPATHWQPLPEPPKETS